MTYKLANKLSDSGFEPILGGKGQMIAKEIKDAQLIDPFYAPSLEELINACGEEFRCLLRDDKTWIASDNVFGHRFQGKGKTPLIAVANLWLALQKN